MVSGTTTNGGAGPNSPTQPKDGWVGHQAIFKDRDDVKAHIKELQKGVDRVRDLIAQLDKTRGKTERDKLKSGLQREIDQVKGHEKDLQEKPKVKDKDQSQ